jgi:hypothetical protein
MRRALLGFFVLSFAVLMVGSIATNLFAGDCCCAHCGCVTECHKTCRLVTEEKKVEVVCWGCKSEDFCVGCHSEPGCMHCEEVCGACDFPKGTGQICVKPHAFVWREWIPGTARIHTKKKLMKKSITKKVPSHKWVVEDLCPTCRAACQ